MAHLVASLFVRTLDANSKAYPTERLFQLNTKYIFLPDFLSNYFPCVHIKYIHQIHLNIAKIANAVQVSTVTLNCQVTKVVMNSGSNQNCNQCLIVTSLQDCLASQL